MAVWRVEVGYVGLDKEWHWGCYARGQKSLAKIVFKKFKDANRTRLFKDSVLVCEVNGPEIVSDPQAFEEFNDT